MRIAALVFDFDGLIVDTELPEYLTIRAEFEAHGVELPLDDWLITLGRADTVHWLDQLEQLVDGPIQREVVHARRRAAHAALIARTEVLPGVVDLLDEAERRGLKVAVASGSPRWWVEGQLDRLGIRGRFDVLRTRDDVVRGKPWPDVYLDATAALGVDPTASVAFEDSHNGSLAATAAGLFCVVAPNELTRNQSFDHADLVVASLVDVDLDDLARRTESRQRGVA